MSKILIYFIFFTMCGASSFEMQNQLNLSKFKIQTWKDIRDKNIIKQSFDYSCGASSIATLLNNFYGQNLSEKDILSALNNENLMISFDDMQRILPNFGFNAKGYLLNYEELMKIKIPVIVYVKYRKFEHFSVLCGIDKNTILLADSSLGNISMSKNQFLSIWKTKENFGKILAILPLNSHFAINTLFFDKNPKRKTNFILKNIKNWQKF